MYLSFRNYITVGAALLGLTAANLLIWHNQAVGFVILPGTLMYGFVLGRLALPKLPFGMGSALGMLAAAATKILLGTALYYAVGLGPFSILTVESLPFFILAAWWSRRPKPLHFNPNPYFLSRTPDIPAALLGLTVIFLDLGAFRLLDISRTASAIRSPWELVPWQFFILFGIASVGLFSLAIVNRGRRIILPLSILHTFIGLGVALTIYRMGFGFDPFIHQAAESEILKAGLILPKTPYYIGQYVLQVGNAGISAIPLAILDRLLVPVLSAVLIPLFLHWLAKDNHGPDRPPHGSLSLAAFALLLPLPMLVMTTPQALAYLWLTATATMVAMSAIPGWLAWIFALAAMVTHPIAGIPALAVAAFGSLARLKTISRSPRFLAPLFFLLVMFALPAAFWLQARIGGNLDVKFVRPTVGAIIHLLPLPTLNIPDHFDLPLDLAYLLRWNINAIVAALALLGVWKMTKSGRIKTFIPHTLTATALIGSYLLTRGVLKFPNVISYEQEIFPERLLESAAFVLVPVMAAGMMALLRRTGSPALKIGAVLLFAGMTTSSVYLSYPRVDRYEKNSGWSLSASMESAVRFLETKAQGSHIVLADQNAAAAQIKNFGFGPYYYDSYFYSHPSGGLSLYRFYQRMVEDGPTRETAEDAMDFAGTNKVYFIIHDYWKNFPRLVAQAEKTADDWAEIDGGAVYIFRYTRSGAPGVRTSEEIF